MTPHLPLIPAMAVVQWGVNPFRTNKDFKFAGRTAILLVVYRRPHGDAPSPAKSRARAIGRGVPPSPPGITTRLPGGVQGRRGRDEPARSPTGHPGGRELRGGRARGDQPAHHVNQVETISANNRADQRRQGAGG